MFPENSMSTQKTSPETVCAACQQCSYWVVANSIPSMANCVTTLSLLAIDSVRWLIYADINIYIYQHTNIYLEIYIYVNTHIQIHHSHTHYMLRPSYTYTCTCIYVPIGCLYNCNILICASFGQ